MAIPIRKKIKRKLAILKDKLFGYDFLTTISPEDIGLDPNHFSRCSPSANKYLIKMLNSILISNNDSIIDIGCGKGAVINILLNYKFKKIHGIEISEKLADICKKNFLRKKDYRVEIINKDAREYENFNDFNYYYLYNPCSNKILNPIIKKIVESATNKKTIIYNFPKYEHTLIKYGFIYKTTYEDEWGNGIKIFELNNF